MKIRMTKKGFQSVVIESGVYSNGTPWYVVEIGKVRIPLADKDKANITYRQYLTAGYNADFNPDETEKKAPKSKTPHIKWCKEGRKIWATEASNYKRWLQSNDETLKGLKGREYHDYLENAVKDYMKIWEAKNADQINATLE